MHRKEDEEALHMLDNSVWDLKPNEHLITSILLRFFSSHWIIYENVLYIYTVHQHIISCLYFYLYLLTEMTLWDPRSLTQESQIHKVDKPTKMGSVLKDVSNKWQKKKKKATVISFTVHKNKLLWTSLWHAVPRNLY